MSEPIVFLSHNRIRDGKLGDFRKLWDEAVPLIKAEKPGTLLCEAHVNEDGSELTIVHVLANADATDELMMGAGERAKRAYEFIESDRFEIYGTPSDGVLEMMGELVGSGVVLSLTPENVGGYIRLRFGNRGHPVERRAARKGEIPPPLRVSQLSPRQAGRRRCSQHATGGWVAPGPSARQSDACRPGPVADPTGSPNGSPRPVRAY